MNGSRVRAFNAGDTWNILGRHATDSIAVTILSQMPHTEIDDFFYTILPKKCGICLIFFKSNAVFFWCFVDNFDVLSTKQQLVDERLG